MKTALIILPSYNEKENIKKLIPQIFLVAKKIVDWKIAILVVDDNSPDHTAEAVKQLQKEYNNLYLSIGEKHGLGKAYARGFEYGLKTVKPFVFFEMDSDLQHDPQYIPLFLKKIEEGADFVIGSRYMKGGSIPKKWGIDRKIESIAASLIMRLGFMKLNVTEWTNGYRAIRSWVVEKAINHIQNYSGYVFQIAFLDFAITHKVKITEIPIEFKDRKEGESKINAKQYAMHALSYMVTHSSFIKFALVGGFGFLIDSIVLYVNLDILHFSNWLSKLISAEIAMMSNFILNNFWSFSHKKIENNILSYFKKFVKFNIVSAGSIFIQIILFSSILTLFPTSETFLKLLYNGLIILFVIIPYSFILYNKFIWKE